MTVFISNRAEFIRAIEDAETAFSVTVGSPNVDNSVVVHCPAMVSFCECCGPMPQWTDVETFEFEFIPEE